MTNGTVCLGVCLFVYVLRQSRLCIGFDYVMGSHPAVRLCIAMLCNVNPPTVPDSEAPIAITLTGHYSEEEKVHSDPISSPYLLPLVHPQPQPSIGSTSGLSIHPHFHPSTFKNQPLNPQISNSAGTIPFGTTWSPARILKYGRDAATRKK